MNEQTKRRNTAATTVETVGVGRALYEEHGQRRDDAAIGRGGWDWDKRRDTIATMARTVGVGWDRDMTQRRR